SGQARLADEGARGRRAAQAPQAKLGKAGHERGMYWFKVQSSTLKVQTTAAAAEHGTSDSTLLRDGREKRRGRDERRLGRHLDARDAVGGEEASRETPEHDRGCPAQKVERFGSP